MWGKRTRTEPTFPMSQSRPPEPGPDPSLPSSPPPPPTPLLYPLLPRPKETWSRKEPVRSLATYPVPPQEIWELRPACHSTNPKATHALSWLSPESPCQQRWRCVEWDPTPFPQPSPLSLSDCSDPQNWAPRDWGAPAAQPLPRRGHAGTTGVSCAPSPRTPSRSHLESEREGGLARSWGVSRDRRPPALP